MSVNGTHGLMCLVATGVLAGLVAASAGANVGLATSSCTNIKPGIMAKRGFQDITLSGGARCLPAGEVLSALSITGPTKTPILGFTCTVRGSAVSCIEGKQSIKARET